MTPKQTQRLVKKIADIKRALAAEKRKFGSKIRIDSLQHQMQYLMKVANVPGVALVALDQNKPILMLKTDVHILKEGVSSYFLVVSPTALVGPLSSKLQLRP